MAGKEALKELEEELQCAICLGTYTEPKLLTCSHVFCVKCLPKLVSAGNIVNCPTCRRATSIPVSGVNGLPSAFRINKLLKIHEFLKVDPPLPLDGLPSTDNEDGKECAALSVERLRTLSNCSEHTKQDLQLYCEECEKPVCIECALDSAKHYTHKPTMLEKVCNQRKAEIEASLEPLKKQLTTIGNALSQVDQQHGEISQQQQSIEAELHNTAIQLHQAVDARTNELVEQLHQCTQTKLKGLTSQREKIETMLIVHQNCEAAVEEKLNTGSNLDIVTKKEDTILKIETLTSSFQLDLLRPNATANLKFSSGDVAPACQSYGKIDEVEMLPDPSKCFIIAKGLGSLEVEQKGSVFMRAVGCNGQLFEGDIQTLECEFVSELTGTKSEISIDKKEKSLYEFSFTPTVKGRHQFLIAIGNQPINGFPLFCTVNQPLEKIGTPISTITDVKTPWGVAINNKGDVIVTEQSKHCVSVFSPNGTKLRSFGTRGSEDGMLNEPCGIAVDKNEDILVADSKNHRIVKFMASGTFVQAVGTNGSGPFQFKRPQGIAFNDFNQKVYVVDSGNNRIRVLDSDLVFYSTLDIEGSKNFTFYNPWGITCNKYGQIYVADCKNSRIVIMTAEGTFLRMTKEFAPTLTRSNRFGPVCMAVDGNGVLYVSDYLSRQVSVIVPEESPQDCKQVIQAVLSGKGNSPRGLAVSASGVLYVCNHSKNCIAMF